MVEIFRMQLTQMLAGQRKWIVVVFLVLPVLLTSVTMNAGGLGELKRRSESRETEPAGMRPNRTVIEEPGWETVSAIYLFLVYPQAMCVLLALLYGSSLLGNELDNKTLTYLLTRPVARWRIITGKYLAIVVALIPPILISLVASWLIMGGPGDGLLAGIASGAIGGVIAYNAIFVLLGFIAPRRAMVLALIYGIVFEFLLSFVPAIVNTFTITYYLRSMVVEIVDVEVPAELARIVGGASLGTSLLTLLGMVAFGLGAAALLASRREYVIADQT